MLHYHTLQNSVNLIDYFYQKPGPEITKQGSEGDTTNATESHDTNSSTANSMAAVGRELSTSNRIRRPSIKDNAEKTSGRHGQSSSLDGQSDGSTALTTAAMGIGISSASTNSGDSEVSVHRSVLPSIGLSTSIDLDHSYSIIGDDGKSPSFACFGA